MKSTVKTSELRAGMRVKSPILGAKGDVKVNKGEVLSQLHVDRMNKWNTRKDKAGNSGALDKANPRGIEVEAALGSGNALPDVLQRPDLSPVIQAESKKNLRGSVRVGVDIKDGKVVRDGEEASDTTTEENTDTDVQPEKPDTKAKRGRPRRKSKV